MKLIKKILTNPITVIMAIVLGVLGGVYFPTESIMFEEVGSIYLSLLKVVVLPFLLATILVGVISILQKDDAAGMIKKIIIGFLISMVIASAIGVASVALTSSEMTPEKQVKMGSLVSDKEQGNVDLEVSLIKPKEVNKDHSPPIFNKFIPENIFQSLNTGESLKVVIFCLIFGIALGQIKSEGLQIITSSLQAIQNASISIFKFLNYFLPFALLAMISSQVGKVGLSIFETMLEFIMQQALGGLGIIVIATIVLVIKCRDIPFLQLISTVKDSIIVAISSRSSLACIPYAQEALNKLRFDKGSVELMIPLSFTVNRVGSITYYAISTLFIANIYGISLTWVVLGIVLVGAILAGLASAGTTGVLTVATVSIVCDLLQLPHEAIIVLLIAVDPIMDMIRTASHVYGNMAVTGFVCDRQEISKET
jgi:proton glutamate symport protein